MAIARWSDGEVYMYYTSDSEGNSSICCQGCVLKDSDGSVHIDTPEEALDHLYKHRSEGHEVPDHAIKRLLREINEKLGF